MKKTVSLFLCFTSIGCASSITPRIIGGNDASAGAFPYAAAIYKTTPEGTYFCTGSILNSKWVITAGQCVDGATLFKIIVGAHKLSGDDASKQEFATDSYVLHPGYDPLTLKNDIGLIAFRLPITFTSYINRLYVPFSDIYPGSVGSVYGWGQTSDSDSSLSDILQYVNLSAVSDEECKITYGDQIQENMVCLAGNFNEGTCFGDTGSPIIQHVSRGYTVILALASFHSSFGCETPGPSGFTKIYPYNEWINNITSL